MSVKTYLQEQIRLVSLSGYDLFTDEEHALYMEIIEIGKELDKLYNENTPEDEKRVLLDKKKEKKQGLEHLIRRHLGTPRTVRISSVVYGDKTVQGVTWENLKISKKIAEFSCELSRAMGLKPNEATLDLIVIKWKNLDELHQLVVDGFYFPLVNKDGSVENRKYRFYTASAGQLRRDKFVAISEIAWEKIHRQLECGIGWKEVNDKGGICVNKLSAYEALPGSATEEWTDFDIDRVIVVDDFEGEVTERLEFVKPDYTTEIGVKTVKIKHTDGCGMMLPEVSLSNFMFRMPYSKGLLISFDFMKFCKMRGASPVLTDVWGTKHDLKKENIKIILFKSVCKLWKYYDDWEHYKKCFKENNCHAGRTNYEEEFLPDKTISYQFLQSLVDFTDEEIKTFTAEAHEKIKNLTKDKDAMLKILGADPNSESPYKAALHYYPELLREAYSKEALKAIRKKVLLDAKSGKIKCQNKRLYACPDLYAVCEHLFLGEENPKGLLKNGEVACKVLRRHDKADVLRSPHLSFEHAIRNIVQDQDVYDWFYTNGIYTSTHDLITRILQLDVDGDQLNVVTDPTIVKVAERNAQKFDFVPLYYDAGSADPEEVTFESMYHGLKRAHDFSSGGITSIGEISNMLTRVWNKENPDRHVAKLLCYFNNLVIDAAKSGKINHYKDYPKIARRIGKATGGKNGRMPYWFQFSKNQRKANKKIDDKKYAEPNNSTMNRICRAFDDIGKINLNYAGVAQFNWQMLLSEPCTMTKPEIPALFCELDSRHLPKIIESQDQNYTSERQLTNGINMAAEEIVRVFTEEYGSLEAVYPFIAKYLFAGEGINRSAHKLMFWKVFGHIALKNLLENLKTCDKCDACGMKIPSWVRKHICTKNIQGFYECVDCGRICERKNGRQFRCEECQEDNKKTMHQQREKARRHKLKEEDKERIMRLLSSSAET